ncbi:putative reverse transcriptase domain-containing protein [Tanacetum coccineum]
MGTVFDRQLRVTIREGMIRRVMTVAVMIGRMEIVIRRHGRTEVSSTTVLLGLQVKKDTQTMPPLLHVTHVENFIRARHVTRLLELVSLVVRQGIWPGIALRMVEMVVGEMGTTINLLLRGEYFLRPRIRRITLQSDNEYQNCPLRFDDKIRFANFLPLEMSDFDIILGMDWLAEHRAPINLQEEEGGVEVGDSGRVIQALGAYGCIIGSDNGSISSELEARVSIQGELLDDLENVFRKKRLTTESAVHFLQRELQYSHETLILRTFLATIHARIVVFNKNISLGIVNDRILFDMNGTLSRPPTSLASVCMAKTILEEESFYLLGIAKDLFPYNSPLCVEFEKFNHILETNESEKPYFMDYEKFYLEFRDEINQLANEYELRIRNKGDIFQNIWDKCGEASDDSPESWYEDRFKEEGKRKCSMYKIPYYPQKIMVPTAGKEERRTDKSSRRV